MAATREIPSRTSSFFAGRTRVGRLLLTQRLGAESETRGSTATLTLEVVLQGRSAASPTTLMNAVTVGAGHRRKPCARDDWCGTKWGLIQRNQVNEAAAQTRVSV